MESATCRLCLAPSDPSALIALNQSEDLIKSVFHITSVEVIIDPNSHVYMCQNCLLTLEQCIQFRTICIHNDRIFREMYATTSVKVEADCDEPALDHVKTEPKFGGSEHDQTDSVEEVQKITVKKVRKSKVKEAKKSTVKEENKKRTRRSRKSNARQVQCQECGKMISHTNLVQHLRIHDPDRQKLICPHCPKFYYEPSELKKHINAAHTQEIQYPCEQCDKVYMRSSGLREHKLATHSKELRYECEICGKKFARPAAKMYHHKMVHETAYPFSCDFCEKTFKFKTDLTVHRRIHTGEKPFKCDICHKAFNKSYNVVIHKKSHLNDKKRNVSTLLETQDDM